MHIPHTLSRRFAVSLAPLTDTPEVFANQIRIAGDPSHGDYQANFAMPLAKRIGKAPRELAQSVIEQTDLADLCEPPSVAGPGFINLRLRDSWLIDRLQSMLGDQRCGVEEVDPSHTIVVDFSSPNVAKPLHVGHIRSTFIGDCLAKTLRFLGHQVVTDNHLGDWGTQFGIIIYGFKHFGSDEALTADPIGHLTTIYRSVYQLMEYWKAVDGQAAEGDRLAASTAAVAAAEADLESSRESSQPAKAIKKKEKELAAARRRQSAAQANCRSTQEKIESLQSDPELKTLADRHRKINQSVLAETAKLHAGDETNRSLWERFLPLCMTAIDGIYERLSVEFDHVLGESFYHAMLEEVVTELDAAGLVSSSDGATCVFLDGFDSPMIVRKQDGAFLYATTDLATLKYRKSQFDPAEILYVVDTRQGEHFEKLFAVAEQLGLDEIKLVHVNFGTVLGKDGKPMKTRSGTLVGLEGLLDDAVARARAVVCDPQRLAKFDPPMDEAEQASVSDVVGMGAIKFADLHHHRASDYRFDLEKMVALEGNTATYVQYSYARTQSILSRAEMAETDIKTLSEFQLASGNELTFAEPSERQLAFMLTRFEEVLAAVHQDYAPNLLTDYLLDTARAYSRFNDNCPVLKADTDSSRTLRLILVTLTGRVLQTGLSLLGIGVVPRM